MSPRIKVPKRRREKRAKPRLARTDACLRGNAFLLCSAMSPALFNPLTMKLRDLDYGGLQIGCSGRSTVIPVSRLTETRGTHIHLAEVLPKLRCRQCGQAPDYIMLTDSQTYGASGVPPSRNSWTMDFTSRASARNAAAACIPVGTSRLR